MKKGDKVLASDNSFIWYDRIFDHEHDGVFYCKHHQYTLPFPFNFCKPAKPSVEEWTEEWFKKQVEVDNYKLFNKYYTDRKRWEEGQ